MRYLVCGSHLSYDPQPTWDRMDKLSPLPTLIISGGAPGVDTWAEEWAKRRGVPCMVFPAPWDFHKNSAGPIRNAWMLRFGQPDLVLALPGGTGTADMVKKARAAHVEVIQVPGAIK